MITHEIINSKLSEVKLLDEEMVIREIEDIITDFNLTVTQKTTLSTLKGSIHYHLKLGKAAGLLELTYWPKKHRLWIEIHNNRLAEWNKAMITPFSERIAELFSGQVQITND